MNTVLLSRIQRQSKLSAVEIQAPLWRHQWRSFLIIPHTDNIKREIYMYMYIPHGILKRESALSTGCWQSL